MKYTYYNDMKYQSPKTFAMIKMMNSYRLFHSTIVPIVLFLLLFLLTCCKSATAKLDGIDSNNRSNNNMYPPYRQKSNQPTHFFVFGDKFSGVSYTTFVLNNFWNMSNTTSPLKECNVSQHHTPTSSSSSSSGNSSNNHINKRHDSMSWRYGFFNTKHLQNHLDCKLEKTLFIMVVKDPFSWLTSVGERLFQTSPHSHFNPNINSNTKPLRQMHIMSLVMHQWDDDRLNMNGGMGGKKASKNLLIQRTRKLRHHYSILSKMKHSVIVRYEDILNNPVASIKHIIRGHVGLGGLDNILTNTFKNMTHAMEMNSTMNDMMSQSYSNTWNKKDYYTNKQYMKLWTPTTMKQGQKHLDQRLESTLGYDTTTTPFELDMKSYKSIKERRFMFQVWNLIVWILHWTVIPTIMILLVLVPAVVYFNLKKRMMMKTGMKNDKHD